MALRPEHQFMTIDDFAVSLSRSPRWFKPEQLRGEPYGLSPPVFPEHRPARQPGDKPLVRHHEPGCPVPQNLRRHFEEMRGEAPVLEVRVLLVKGDIYPGEGKSLVPEFPEVALFANFRVVNIPLAVHPESEASRLLLGRVASEFYSA